MNLPRGKRKGDRMSRSTTEVVDGALADILAASPIKVEAVRLGLGMTIEEFAETVGRSVRTVSRWQTADGDTGAVRGSASRDVRRLAQLQFLVEEVLGREYAVEWLRSVNRGFNGKAPIDLVLEGHADVVIAALERLADGGPA